MSTLSTQEKSLLRQALAARENAYAPYSRFQVGAVLTVADGSTFCGCNIENAAFTPGICAERTAIYKAVSEGKRAFTAIAIAGGSEDSAPALTAPCGVCRQVMAEFCDPETFRIVLMNGDGEIRDYLLKELLPLGFTGKALEK